MQPRLPGQMARVHEGISRTELATVFDRFKRASGAPRRGIGGIGLGLYVARGLVEANGGRMWVEIDPGATTAFRFELPIAQGDEAERDPPHDALH